MELESFHGFFEKIKNHHSIVQALEVESEEQIDYKLYTAGSEGTDDGTVKAGSDNDDEWNKMKPKKLLTVAENTSKKRGRPRKNPVEGVPAKKRRGRPRRELQKPLNELDPILPERQYRKRTHQDEQKIAEFAEMKCDLCNIPLKSFSDAQAHHKDVHNQKGFLKCCGKKYRQRSVLVDHVAYHADPSIFTCTYCNKRMKTMSHLRTHLVISHSAQQYFCDKCPKKFSDKYKLSVHARQHVIDAGEKTEHHCSDCDKFFLVRSSLIHHIKFYHTENKPLPLLFMCHICSKQLRTAASLKEHVAAAHFSPYERLECPRCHHFLKNKYNYRKHMERHEQEKQNLSCKYCGKISPNKAALGRHTQYVHILKRDQACSYCPKMFKQKIDLQEHEATHTKLDIYFCQHCPASFKFGANYRSHRKNSHPEEYERNDKPAWLKPVNNERK